MKRPKDQFTKEFLDKMFDGCFPEIKNIDRWYRYSKDSMHILCQIEHGVSYVPSHLRKLSIQELLEQYEKA